MEETEDLIFWWFIRVFGEFFVSLDFFGMDPFDSLRGHYGLQTASVVRSDLRFEISDLNYLHIHVHIAYVFWAHFEALLMASEATAASKRPQI